jgi:hypothetical protein
LQPFKMLSKTIIKKLYDSGKFSLFLTTWRG